MNILLFISMLSIFCGSFSFIMNYYHLLNSLLSLELLAVMIFFLISAVFLSLGLELFYVLYFLVMLVCEGVLGLSLLIVSVYSYGEDYLSSFSTLMC